MRIGGGMMRTILHSDANSFYASCEIARRPELKHSPVSVGGSEELRHGIILASNTEAKSYGVKTAMPLWQARKLCPNLTILPPDFKHYISVSRCLREMYDGLSPVVESFGLDECWIDLSSRGTTLKTGEEAALYLRERAKKELGITLSVGVSYNKVFAKLASDYKKPDATTLISEDNYKSIAWPLPANDMIFIGNKTKQKLNKYGIRTIGDVARTPPECLENWFGKLGYMHHANANGLDRSPVMKTGYEVDVKSIGNSTTTPRDMRDLEDVKCVFTILAQSVSTRVREAYLKGKCIAISVRDTNLNISGAQKTLPRYTALCRDIIDSAMELFISKGFEKHLPLRSIGVKISSLVPYDAPEQLSMFSPVDTKIEAFESAVFNIRKRYGIHAVQLGNVLLKDDFLSINPKEEHTVHPLPFFSG